MTSADTGATTCGTLAALSMILEEETAAETGVPMTPADTGATSSEAVGATLGVLEDFFGSQ